MSTIMNHEKGQINNEKSKAISKRNNKVSRMQRTESRVTRSAPKKQKGKKAPRHNTPENNNRVEWRFLTN